MQVGVCPRCGYVGWAPSVELTEGTRRGLRERPVEQRACAPPESSVVALHF